MHLILFLAFGAVCVAGAVNLLTQRHPINSALSLIAVMAALAGEWGKTVRRVSDADRTHRDPVTAVDWHARW